MNGFASHARRREGGKKKEKKKKPSQDLGAAVFALQVPATILPHSLATQAVKRRWKQLAYSRSRPCSNAMPSVMQCIHVYVRCGATHTHTHTHTLTHTTHSHIACMVETKWGVLDAHGNDIKKKQDCASRKEHVGVCELLGRILFWGKRACAGIPNFLQDGGLFQKDCSDEQGFIPSFSGGC